MTTDAPTLTQANAGTASVATLPLLRPAPSLWDTKENNFDILRCFAAIIVIYSHSFPLSGDREHEPPYGTLAVNVFFIISGFLITMSWQRTKGARAFLKKRIARILPAYWVVAFLGYFVAAPFFVADRHELFSYIWVRRFFTNGLQLREIVPPHVFPNNPFPGTINGSMWTICYEFWCYIGIMVLGLCGFFNRFRWVPPAFLLVFWVSFARGQDVPFPGPLAPLKAIAFFVGSMSTWPRFGMYYMFGTCFFLFRRWIPMRWEIAAVAALVVFESIAIDAFPPAIFPPALCYLTLWVACQPFVRFPNFARYGDFSYGIYLYAFPIQQILVALFPGRFTPWTLFSVAAPLAVIAGALSWHIVEKRFLLRVRGRVPGAHGEAAPKPQPAR